MIEDDDEVIPYHMLLNENEPESEDEGNDQQPMENAGNSVLQMVQYYWGM